MKKEEDQHFCPTKSDEFKEKEYWKNQTNSRELTPIRTIAAWSDICGFGNALSNAGWDLSKLKDNGLFEVLGEAHYSLGKPFLSGVPPMPAERVLVINDGVARTIDLMGPEYVDRANLLFYVRNLLMYHYMVEQNLVNSGLGLRTVLAGGERCQYSSQKLTGHSLLLYTNEPSEFGKKFLEQQFVYNPVEFQMNTAFALAFTLEAMGSKKGLIPNRVYIEQNWLNTLNSVIPGFCQTNANFIHFSWREEPGLSISFDNSQYIELIGISTTIYRASSFIVHERFAGDNRISNGFA